tara:strand:- start:1180 stop:1653 length:474 start_codon:yes stop_codon:yes gene_type:complete
MGFGFIKKPFKAVGKAISSVGSGVKTITKDTWDGITDIGSAIVDPIQGLGAGTGELARENPTLALGALTGNPALTAAGIAQQTGFFVDPLTGRVIPAGERAAGVVPFVPNLNAPSLAPESRIIQAPQIAGFKINPTIALLVIGGVVAAFFVFRGMKQ